MTVVCTMDPEKYNSPQKVTSQKKKKLFSIPGQFFQFLIMTSKHWLNDELAQFR